MHSPTMAEEESNPVVRILFLRDQGCRPRAPRRPRTPPRSACAAPAVRAERGTARTRNRARRAMVPGVYTEAMAHHEVRRGGTEFCA